MQNQFNWPLWHWHFEVSSICTLQCPRCPRTEIPGSLVQTQLKLDFFKNNFDIDGIGKITFCGDDGDPIYARDFIEIVRWFKQKDPTIGISIVTNGSYKSADWWKELGSVLNQHDQVHFSLDGFDQASNEKYRVNCNWDSIIEGVHSLRANTNAVMIWDAIAFRFNEHHIDHMKSLATQWGFDTFQLTLSTKFGSKYEHYSTQGTDDLEPSKQYISSSHRFERQITDITGRKPILKNVLKTNVDYYNKVKAEYKDQPIIPLCLIGTKGIFVNSQGFMIPCCWIGNRYNHTGLDKFLVPSNNIKTHGLESVLNNSYWKSFIQDFHSMQECKSKCTSSLVTEEYATNW
jgi:MoaA/NifB/PqqE/SkfB family radical SAM enzyme